MEVVEEGVHGVEFPIEHNHSGNAEDSEANRQNSESACHLGSQSENHLLFLQLFEKEWLEVKLNQVVVGRQQQSFWFGGKEGELLR